jgi:ABC-type antimicrobial peptide transport system permease subunit
MVTALKPLMGVALSLTLILTGFACAFVAMAIPRTTTERGVVLLTAVSLAVFSPWVGMVIGIAATVLLVGTAPHHAPDDEIPL